jgi:hypothetical protein
MAFGRFQTIRVEAEHITGFIRRKHWECRLSGRTMPEHDLGRAGERKSRGNRLECDEDAKKEGRNEIGGYFCLLGKPNGGSKKSA